MTFEINTSFEGKLAIASTSRSATTLPSTTPALNVNTSGLSLTNFDTAFESVSRESVLDDRILRARLIQLTAQLLIFRHREFVEADEHRGGRFLKLLREGFQVFLFLF